MNTRKSSPLPNPQQNIHHYQIAYRHHHQNLHKHLLTRIYCQESLKNQLIKEFTHLAKIKDTLETQALNNNSITSSSTTRHREKHQKQQNLQHQNIHQDMQLLFDQICLKQLEISKLFDQSQGVLLQLCDMLKHTDEDMKKIRQSNDKSLGQIRFLHHQGRIYNINQTKPTKTNISTHDTAEKSSSFDQEKFQTKNGTNRSFQNIINGSKLSNQIQSNNESKEFQTTFEPRQSKKLEIEQTLNISFGGKHAIEINSSSLSQQIRTETYSTIKKQRRTSQKQVNLFPQIQEETQIKEKEKNLLFMLPQREKQVKMPKQQFLVTQHDLMQEQPKLKDQNRSEETKVLMNYEIAEKMAANNQEKSESPSKIDSILHLYEKGDRNSPQVIKNSGKKDVEIIEISSSNDGSFEMRLNQSKLSNTSRNEGQNGSKNFEVFEVKREKKSKQKIKSCITILD